MDALTAAIDAVTSRISARDLGRAAEALSARYRAGASGTRAVDQPLTDAERAAYLAVRAPATFAAVSAVLHEVVERCGGLDVQSVLDLGAGPGAATWAALARFPQATRVTLVERDRGFTAIGREILEVSGLSAGRTTEWRAADLRRDRVSEQTFDLVLLSYALGELPVDARALVVDAAWNATRGALVIVEPGTPPHFAVVLDARTQLLSRGAAIAAPCPHASACPMAAADDWCHVAVRLPRSKQHRRLKSGSLAYEDEKFSYVVFTRVPARVAGSRIVRHPRFEKGRVLLTRCTTDGLVTDTIGHRARESYRLARKARWGDAWDVEASAQAREPAQRQAPAETPPQVRGRTHGQEQRPAHDQVRIQEARSVLSRVKTAADDEPAHADEDARRKE